MRMSIAIAVAWVSLVAVSVGDEARAVIKRPTNIAAQGLAPALQILAKERDLQVLYRSEVVGSLRTGGVAGELTVDEALAKLLSDTGLTYSYLDDKTVTIVPVVRGSAGGAREQRTLSQSTGIELEKDRFRVAQSASNAENSTVQHVTDGDEESKNGPEGSQDSSAAQGGDGEGAGIPEILVTGSKILNVDLRRTEDDIQPYIVFDQKMIESSGAVNLGEFFKNQLTTNVTSLSENQVSSGGGRSSINLRGLGSDETLILIDGRRIASHYESGLPFQPDINGIPLSAIERIEVLPTTASGIYGGGATGGVINIVLRRDYSGVDTKLTYGNTFESDATERRIDLSGGFDLGNDRTTVLLSASYADTNPLLNGERDLIERARRHIFANNPGAFLNAAPPPLGATPNIRSALVGGVRPNLTLDDGTPLDAAITHVPEGYAGVSTDGGAALLANAGQFNLNLPNTAQQDGAQHSLVGAPEAKSAMISLRHVFTSRLQAFLDLRGEESTTEFRVNNGQVQTVIPGNAATNPFQEAIQITVPAVGLDDHFVTESEARHGVMGVIVGLPRKWQASGDFTWSRSRVSSEAPHALAPETLTAIGNGQLDILRDVNQFPAALVKTTLPSSGSSPAEFTLKNASLRLAGPLPWSLPAGDLVLTTLVEHQDESMNDVIQFFSSGAFRILFPSRSQSVTAVYVESKVPMVSALNAVPGVEVLELQIAARRDDYRVRGATGFIDLASPTPVIRAVNRNESVNPTIGLRYQPIKDITVRASYATGFKPPHVSQLAPAVPQQIDSMLADPLRGNEPLGSVDLITGGNPELLPESSESWSSGIILSPRSKPQLRFSADYSRIAKTDNIGSLDISTGAGFQRAIRYFPHRITRAEPSDGFSVGRIIALDDTEINIARLDVEVLDLALDYELETSRFGAADFSLGATHLIRLETQDVPDAPPVENAGVVSTRMSDGASGVKWKANAAINWTYNNWNLGWRTRFFDSYFLNPAHAVVGNQGSATVPSQTYHDLFGSYRFGSSANSGLGVLADTEIHFGVTNVYNKEPPVDVSSGIGLRYSYLGDPRLASYYVSIRKSFDF